MMCDHGDYQWVMLHATAKGSDVETAYRPVWVDTCIAAIVKELDDRGYRMLGSCCGHDKSPAFAGTNPGSIIFAPGSLGIEREELTIPEVLTLLTEKWSPSDE